MKTIEISEATGPVLDYLVAKANGAKKVELYKYNGRTFLRAYIDVGIHAPWEPSRYWNQGGPIIEREKISVWVHEDGVQFRAAPKDWMLCDVDDLIDMRDAEVGLTPLIAAMRCFVASKLGDTAEVPEELYG